MLVLFYFTELEQLKTEEEELQRSADNSMLKNYEIPKCGESWFNLYAF